MAQYKPAGNVDDIIQSLDNNIIDTKYKFPSLKRSIVEIIKELKVTTLERLKVQQEVLPINLFGPGVYIIYAGSDVVYIGMSKCLINRVGVSIQMAAKIHTNLIVSYIPTETVEEAFELERDLIYTLEPSLNKTT